MKIVLTGGTGFVGSHFLQQSGLLNKDIIAIRRNSESKTRLQIEHDPNWLNGQYDDVNVSDIKGCKTLVHLATHTGNVPYDSLENCIYWNVYQPLKLLDKARKAGIEKFIIAGSCFEYGRSGEHYQQIPSDAPLDPTNSYATSKALASIAFKQWADTNNLSLEILRVFHVYGEGELQTRFWPSLRRAALNNEDFPMTEGLQIRDFQPVEKVANTFLKRALNPELTQKTLVANLGTGKPLTIRKFAEHYWKKWDAKGNLLIGKVPYRKNEVMTYIPQVDIKI